MYTVVAEVSLRALMMEEWEQALRNADGVDPSASHLVLKALRKALPADHSKVTELFEKMEMEDWLEVTLLGQKYVSYQSKRILGRS